MNRDEAEEYTQALGQVVSGGWRQILLGERLGVPRMLGLSTEEWVQDRLGGYVRLSVEERREAVAELTEKEGLSNVAAAEILGVSDQTVGNDRRASKNLETGPEDPQVSQPDHSKNLEPEPAPCPMENWAAKKRTLRGMLLTFEQNTSPEQSEDIIPLLEKTLRAHRRNAERKIRP